MTDQFKVGDLVQTQWPGAMKSRPAKVIDVRERWLTVEMPYGDQIRFRRGKDGNYRSSRGYTVYITLATEEAKRFWNVPAV